MRTIVVGLDESEEARRALAWAATAARAVHGELVVLTAVPDVLGVVPAAGTVVAWPEVAAVATERQKAALQAAGLDDLDVVTRVESGHPAGKLVGLSRHADLVVMGGHGRGPIAGRLTGSVSHHVATHAACPLVVVHGEVGPVRRIVVGVDGSAGSMDALRWSLDLARDHGARVTAVWAVDRPAVLDLLAAPMEVPPSPGLLRDVAEEGLERALRAVGAGPEVDRVIEEGRPDRVLLDVAADADLVVVGRRGLGGFVGMLLGSVGHRVLHHAPCPVAIIPPIE